MPGSGVAAEADDAAGAGVLAEVPWAGFGEAADAALAFLQERLGMELWAVTQVREGTQHVVVARSGELRVPPGTALPWADSLCRQMLAGTAPRVAPDVRSEAAYAGAGFSRRFPVGAYVGVPLLDAEGRLFGTLCGLSAAPQPEGLVDELPMVELIARLLGTVLAKEAFAAERSAAAAAAYAAVDRDPLTDVLNRRGWERALAAEEQRCLRSGGCSAVAVVDIDDLAAVNAAQGHEAGDELLGLVARVLESSIRSCDEVARVGGDEFGLIAADAGSAEGVRAWTTRLRYLLDAAGVRVSVGAAASTSDHPLRLAWQDAEVAMRADRSARRGPVRRAP